MSTTDDSPDDIPAPVTDPWHGREAEIAATSFVAMARRLPGITSQALRLAFEASKRDTVITIGLNLAAGVLTAVGLFATTGVLAPLFAGGPSPDRVRAALPSLFLVAAAGIGRAALSAAAGWAQARLEPQVNLLVERRLFELTTHIRLAAYDDPEFYETLQRSRTRGLMEAPRIVSSSVDICSAVVGIAAAGGVLVVLHPVLLLLLAIAALPDGWAAVRSAKMGYANFITLSASLRRKWLVSDLMAERRSAAEVRSFTMRDFLLEEYDRTSAHEMRSKLALARKQTFVRLYGEAVGGAAIGLVFLTLGVLLLTGMTPLAVAGTAVLAINTGQSALQRLLFAVNSSYESGLYFSDYQDFLAQAEQRLPKPATRSASETLGEIVADDLTFTYPGEERPALDGASVRIQAGEVIALVGENGSGKTTLAKILAGLYEPDSGQVTWDGVDISTVDHQQLWDQLAVIAQEYTQWPFTARRNITMADDHDDARIGRAAATSGADVVIDELPRGYDTLLDKRFEGGHDLSGGQWQRLIVARGLYRERAALLICDEPTAALDARAEHALFEAVRKHTAGRTVLLITHRLASVRYADRIYVLDHGKVIERGTHAELMAHGGTYAELYTLQANAYQAGQPSEPKP
jgi:ATP-binding cassette subfamily B protein